MQPGATWHNAIDRELFNRCENKERAYDVVVFDTWLINQDRHSENLVVRVRSGQHTLILNDHSHLLVSPCGPQKMEELMACLDHLPGRFVRLPFVRDSITSATRLSESLDRIEALSDAEIRGIVHRTPPEFLPEEGRSTYADFLTQRHTRLRALFNSDLTAFPKLRKKTI